MGKFRTRTGCATCRARRVKCDEREPACLRCEKAGRECRKEDIRSARYATPKRYDSLPKSHFVSQPSLSPITEPPSAQTVPVRPLSIPQLLQSPTTSLPREHAMLLQHYVLEVGAILDSNDERRRFTVGVPAMALRSPVLLNAVLSLSARHLSRTRGYELVPAEEFEAVCVSHLLHSLDSPADETLLAATVILRITEQMNVPMVQQDRECHLSGTTALISTDPSLLGEGLREAAFWVFIRQDIYMSIILLRPMHFDVTACPQIRFGKDDSSWANRAIWIVAHIVQSCFATASADRFQELSAQLDAWDSGKPTGFVPYCIVERDVTENRLIPEVYLIHPWHISGLEYYAIGRILLAIYSPSRLPTPRNRREMDSEVLYYTRLILGIAYTNKDPQGRIIASNALSLCGEWVTDRNEQKLALELLVLTQREIGWPTKEVQNKLIKEWNI